MATATSENLLSRQERLKASMQAARETIRQALLEKLAAIIEAQREMEQELREELREGLEREALLGSLVTVRSLAESGAELFGKALEIVQGDPVAVPAIKSQLHAAEGFLARVRALEARISASPAPFDESRLPPDHTGPTAEGYLSISEARVRAKVVGKL